ncbi:MAG: quinoprotein dehydrogenase-associated putative ABC transporter substrate-binding protein, partial [Proteobacteria bacterium]|nr:quinoprotein dehydrogenase-associated putative ABC transporter substrate-binding protein [Pseudomonadota bacterium]
MDRNGTARRLVSLAALVAALGAASGEGRAQTGEVVDRTTLRVCAAP